MADLSDLLKIIPIDDIAEKLGVSEDVAEAAVQQVLPGLVGGLAVNAATGDGASTLETVLSHHAGKDTSSKAKLKDIDTEDGEKIVGHILGKDNDQAVGALAAASGIGDQAGDIIKKILPIVAPIVLAWLANQFLGQKSAPAETAKEESGGGIGDLLGGLLGGGSSSGGGVGDLLGGLLGGGSSSSGSSGGGLGDILGGLLGGKK